MKIIKRTFNGDTLKLMCMSDLHIGSSVVDENKIKEDLETAKIENARILLNGDIFDGILPKDIKRFIPETLTKDLTGSSDILNLVLEKAVRIFKPFANLIDMIGEGNHEASIRKHHSINLVSELCNRLSTAEHEVVYGGFDGFIRYSGIIRSNSKAKYDIYYQHGMGGASPVTKGIIDFSRLGNCFIADLLWIGHKHNRIVDSGALILYVSHRKETLSTRQQTRIMTGSYMKNYLDIPNYAQGLPPQGMGGMLVTVKFMREEERGKDAITPKTFVLS